MHILYVEGHIDSCEMLVLWLYQAGYEVVAAHSMADALKLAGGGGFAAYLLGSRCTDGEELELCQQLRLLDANIPIIFYSPMARESDRKAAVDAGAQAYLIMPDDLENIAPTIKRLTTRVLPKRASE